MRLMSSVRNCNIVNLSQVILIVLGIIGFELVSYLPEAFGQDSRFVTVPYRALYLMICILSIIRYRWNISFDRKTIPVFIFILLYFFRSLYDTFFTDLNIESSIGEFWLYAYLLGFFPMLVLLFPVNKKTLVYSKFSLFFAAITVNILSFGYNFETVNSIELGLRSSGNQIMNTITYGQTGVLMVIMSICFYGDKSFKLKYVLFPLICLGAMNVALAGSRGPFLVLMITSIFFLIYNIKNIGRGKMLLFCCIIFAISVYFISYLVFFDNVIDRLKGTGFNHELEGEERVYIFEKVIKQILDNPVFGYRAIGVYAHNLNLEAFLSLGVVGGLLMVYVILLASSYSLKMIKNPNLNWIGLVFLIYILSAFISGAIWNSFEFWTLLGLSISIDRSKTI